MRTPDQSPESKHLKTIEGASESLVSMSQESSHWKTIEEEVTSLVGIRTHPLVGIKPKEE